MATSNRVYADRRGGEWTRVCIHHFECGGSRPMWDGTARGWVVRCSGLAVWPLLSFRVEFPHVLSHTCFAHVGGARACVVAVFQGLGA